MAPIVVQSSCGSEIGSEHSHSQVQVGLRLGSEWFPRKEISESLLGFWQASLLESSAFMGRGSAHLLLTLKSRGNPGAHGLYLDFHFYDPELSDSVFGKQFLNVYSCSCVRVRLWTQTKKVATQKVSTSQNKYTHTEP